MSARCSTSTNGTATSCKPSTSPRSKRRRSSVRLLFDHNTPAPLCRELPGHDVTSAADRGWAAISNGDLIAAAEEAGSEVLVTADQRIRYQQNLKNRRLALVVLSTNNWNHVKDHVQTIRDAIAQASPVSYHEVELPLPDLNRRPYPR